MIRRIQPSPLASVRKHLIEIDRDRASALARQRRRAAAGVPSGLPRCSSGTSDKTLERPLGCAPPFNRSSLSVRTVREGPVVLNRAPWKEELRIRGLLAQCLRVTNLPLDGRCDFTD
jgi:hypothetical protein